MRRVVLATAWFAAACACSGESAPTQPPTPGAQGAGEPEITAEQYSRVIQELREGNALTARLRAANQRLAPRFRQLDQLPEGKPKAGPPAPPGWTTVASLEELRSHALRAAATRQPVIIHFHAVWATPCAALVELYKQDPVAARLAPYLRLFVNVTEGREASEKIRDMLDAPLLPDVQVSS